MTRRKKRPLLPKARNVNAARSQVVAELAPLTGFAPEKLVGKAGRDRVQEFVLSLAVAFNDLKDLLLIHQDHLPRKPADLDAVEPAVGQWNGIQLHLHRLFVAHLHELLELFRKYSKEADDPAIQRIVENAPSATRRYWVDLNVTARGTADPSNAQFKKIVAQIRNNVGYHYYQPKLLVDGYRAHFFVAPAQPNNEAAYASFGQAMETTRFYFADAAIAGTMRSLTESMGEKAFYSRLLTTMRAVNETIRYVVAGYVSR